MEIDQYYNRQLIGWLSYNPNFDSRNFSDVPENRVCYIYPRYMIDGNRFVPIDSKHDFPTVGRIAVRVQGQDSAADVYNRYGSVVTFRLKGDVTINREANNHFTVRYNVNLGRDRSEVWIDRLDKNLLTEVIQTNLPIERILSSRYIDIPNRRFNSVISNNIMVITNGMVYGPFEGIEEDDRILLSGLERNNFMAGVYTAAAVHPSVLYIADHTDNVEVLAVPSFKFGDLSTAQSTIDLIEPPQLIDLFLDQAKLETDISRAEFREIKDYCNRILNDETTFELSEERSNNLKRLLSTIFERDFNNYRRLVELIIDDERFRYHLIDDIISANDAELIQNLPQASLNSITDEIRERVKKISNVEGVDALTSPVAKVISKEGIDAIGKSFFSEDSSAVFNVADLSQVVNNLIDEIDTILIEINNYNQNVGFLKDSTFDSTYLVEKIQFNPFFILNNINLASTLIITANAISAIIANAIECGELIEDRNIEKDLEELRRLHNKLSNSNKDLESATDTVVKSDIVNTVSQIFDFSSMKLNPDDITPQNREIYEKRLQSIVDQRFGRGKRHHSSLTEEDGKSLSDAMGQDLILKQAQLDKINADLEQAEKDLKNLNKQNERIQKDIKKFDNELESRKEATAKLSKMLDEKIETYKKEREDDATRALSLIDQTILSNVISSSVPTTINVSNLDASGLVQTPVVTQPIYTQQAAPQTVIDPSTTQGANDLPDTKFDMEMLIKSNDSFEAEKIADSVRNYLKKYGGRELSRNEVMNYLICITQGFITTFAGEPGTGKTSLCNLLACALGLSRDDSNNRFTDVSVERGWNSLKDFIGYYNPLTHRLEKSNSEVFDAFYKLNAEAHSAPDGSPYDRDKIAPYLILLDEANLSPIEHYWAAFFRSCDFNSVGHRTINLGGNANWYLPEHLRFLATVNFDHTTEELSARFLDRSWVITLQPTYKNVELETMPQDNEGQMISFGDLMRAFSSNKATKLDDNVAAKWQEIQYAFASENTALPISPRNLKMVENYCLVASNIMDDSSKNRLYSIDYAVAQKILPTINGSGERFKNLIDELVNICDETTMPLCYQHVKRMQRNGGAELGFYQFFTR